MRSWNQTTTRWAGVALVLLIVLMGWAGWRSNAIPASVTIQFAGYTNAPGFDEPMGLFTLASQHRGPVTCWVRIELKDTNGWPVHLDGFRGTAGEAVPLEPGGTTNVVRRIPRLGQGWRVELEASRPVTRTEQARARVSMWCYGKGLDWLGGLFVPGFTWQTERGPEMPPPE